MQSVLREYDWEMRGNTPKHSVSIEFVTQFVAAQ